MILKNYRKFYRPLTVHMAVSYTHLIGTLALQIILQGVAYLICGGMPVSNLPATAKIIGQGYVGPIPFPVIIFVLVMIVATIVLNRTYIGRHFYAIGSNEEAARLSGINTAKLKVATYAIGGFLSGLAGLIMLARISSGQPTAGKNMEMDCLTAAVIGGVSLTGGEGRISTAVCGVSVSYTHLDVYKRQVLNYIESVDMKIGKDIVIGGFVDSEFANRFMNRIPVVYEPVKEMGYEAGGMILKKIEENQEFRVKALKCIYQSNHFWDE